MISIECSLVELVVEEGNCFRISNKGKWEILEIWSQGKIRERSFGKMGLGCGEEVKEKDSFPKISDNIIFFFKLPVNVATNMEVGEGNLGTKKGVNTVHKTHIIFHINDRFSNFLFLGFENHIICKWIS